MNKPIKACDNFNKTAYKPTEKDLERVKMNPTAFKMSGDGVFHTIQGEGNTLGTPITFIRLHFCNLACSWCDSYYTWQKSTKEYWKEPYDLEVKDLANVIKDKQKEAGLEHNVYSVCFTGGEPLLQQDKILKFIELYPEYYVEIETNGTIMPHYMLLEMAKMGKIKFNCSPKLHNSGNFKIARYKGKILEAISKTANPIFKFVAKDETDIREVLDMYSKFILRHQLCIMPEGITKEENAKVYEKIMPFIIKKGLITYPRLQNIAFDGAKRGV